MMKNISNEIPLDIPKTFDNVWYRIWVHQPSSDVNSGRDFSVIKYVLPTVIFVFVLLYINLLRYSHIHCIVFSSYGYKTTYFLLRFSSAHRRKLYSILCHIRKQLWHSSSSLYMCVVGQWNVHIYNLLEEIIHYFKAASFFVCVVISQSLYVLHSNVSNSIHTQWVSP